MMISLLYHELLMPERRTQEIIVCGTIMQLQYSVFCILMRVSEIDPIASNFKKLKMLYATGV